MVQHMLRAYLRETHDLCRAGLCKTVNEIQTEEKSAQEEKKEEEKKEEEQNGEDPNESLENSPFELSDSEDELMDTNEHKSPVEEKKENEDDDSEYEANPFYYGSDYVAGTTDFEDVIGSENFMNKAVFDFLFPQKTRECEFSSLFCNFKEW